MAIDAASVSVATEERHEELRRAVDEWTWQTRELLQEVDPFGALPVGPPCNDIWQSPIGLAGEPRESTPVAELVESDNVPMNKLLTTLAYLCTEITCLRDQAEARFYPQLLVFGLGAELAESPQEEGEAQVQLGEALPEIQVLLGQVARLRALLKNLVLQLAALYPAQPSSSRQLYASFRHGIHLETAVDALARGLGVLLTLDALLAHSPGLAHAISCYKRMAQTVRTEPGKFGLSAAQAEALQKAATCLDHAVLSGRFLQRFIQEDVRAGPSYSALRGNRKWQEEVSRCSQETLKTLTARLETAEERWDDRRRLAEQLACFALLSWTNADALDRRHALLCWELHRRAPCLHLYSVVALHPLLFLAGHLSPQALAARPLKGPSVEALATAWSREHLGQLHARLAKSVAQLSDDVTLWALQLDAILQAKLSNPPVPSDSPLLSHAVQGLSVANTIRTLLRTVLELHAHLEVAVSKEQVRLLMHLARLLKVMVATLFRRQGHVVLGLAVALQSLLRHLSAQLLPLKENLQEELASLASAGTSSSRSALSALTLPFLRGSNQEAGTRLLDALAAATVASQVAARGAPSRQRLVTLGVCLDILAGLNQVKPEEAAAMRRAVLLAGDGASLLRCMHDATDCGFLYWSSDMLGPCLASYYSLSVHATELQFTVSAFVDGVLLMQRGRAPAAGMAAFEKRIEDCLHEEVIERLCRDVETDLRLHVHSARLAGSFSASPTKTGVKDLSWLLQVAPLRLASKAVHVRARVEAYLSATFYDHTAVALHNFQVYEEMRHLAQEKYGLQLQALQVALPQSSLERGLDVVAVLSQLPHFVASYHYNLNTQVFVEKMSSAPDRKHLNTLTAQHVASSLRTHGAGGVAHATVNAAYRHLARQLEQLSQLLFDDRIKSRLLKELRLWREDSGAPATAAAATASHHRHGGAGASAGRPAEGARRYPVERAYKFNKDIRRLGQTEEGHSSYVDAVRLLVTEAGNALGFVRLVRLAMTSLTTSASGYVKDMDEVQGIASATAASALFSAHTREAAMLLDAAVANLRAGASSQHTNYFEILVRIFSPELASSSQSHLRDMYLMVPALVVNAMVALQLAREGLHKRTRDASAAASFTDDGFALGLAYILRVLEQDAQLDALHFFEAAAEHFAVEQAQLQQRSALQQPASVGTDRGGLLRLKKAAPPREPAASEEERQASQMALRQVSANLKDVKYLLHTFSVSQNILSS